MLQLIKLFSNRKYFLFFAIALIPTFLLIINVLQKYFYIVFPTPIYLTMHSILEFFSIVVSFSVFMTAWYGIKQNHNKQDIIICFTFLIFVLLNIAHALSYYGMPDFFTPNNANKASTFWILAVLTNAIGLFLAAQFSPSCIKKWNHLSVFLWITLLITIAVIVLIIYNPLLLPPMFVDGQGQTPIKIFAEYITILLSLAALISFDKYREKENDSTSFLQGALLFIILAELSFTLYSHAYDTFNLLGHCFRIVADYLILQALFVSSLRRPYLQLLKVKEKIQVLADKNSSLYQHARQQRQEIEECFSLIGKAISTRLDLQETLQLIVNLAANMVRARYALVALAEKKKQQFKVLATKGLGKSCKSIPMENSLAGRAYRSKISFCIKDVKNNPSIFLPKQIEDKVSCIIATPIISKNDIVGILELYFEEHHVLSSRESRLLSAFARHAGVALESSLLFQETKRRLKEQQTLYNLVTNLSSPLCLKEILSNCIIDTVEALVATKGAIFLVDESDESCLEQVATNRVFSKETEDDKQIIIKLQENSWLTWTLRKNQPGFFCNTEKQQVNMRPEEWWHYYPTVLIIPLSIKEKLVGALFLGWKEANEEITESYLVLATAIGQQLALGIERNKLYKEVKRAAFTDPLTSLANRRQFSIYLENAILRADRLENPLCLILLDLDKFKNYNDTYGHPAGDKVLTQIGQILLNSIEINNLPVRYGGEEFAIVLPDCDLEGGISTAEQIRKIIEQDYFPDNHGQMVVKITASLGVACYQPNSARATFDLDQLLNQADTALYQAKNTGRNKVCFY